MGACVSRRGDRAECRRCARLPAPSSASPFADAVADAALERVPPAETKRRASFALGRSSGARVSPLTARALAQKAREKHEAEMIAFVEESSSASGTEYSMSSKRVSALTLPAAANSTMSWPDPGAPEPGTTLRQGAGPRPGRRTQTLGHAAA